MPRLPAVQCEIDWWVRMAHTWCSDAGYAKVKHNLSILMLTNNILPVLSIDKCCIINQGSPKAVIDEYKGCRKCVIYYGTILTVQLLFYVQISGSCQPGLQFRKRTWELLHSLQLCFPSPYVITLMLTVQLYDIQVLDSGHYSVAPYEN